MMVKKTYPNLREQAGRFYYDHGGKPRHWEPLGKDFDAALARWREIKGGSAPGNTVGWLLTRFMATRESLAANTIKSYRKSADILRIVFESCPIDGLTRGMVLQFIDEYTLKHGSPHMARNAAIFVKMAYSFAVDREIVSRSPLDGLKLKDKAQRERYLSDGEFMAIRDKLKPVYQVAADLAYLMGLRVSGVCALRWQHIKDGILSFKPPKSKRPISYQISDEVKAVLERARTLPGNVRGLTVICARSGAPMREDAVSKAFSEAAKLAGIEDVRFHDIRAKSASDESSTAQSRLGHTDSKTTATYLRKPVVVTPIKNVKM